MYDAKIPEASRGVRSRCKLAEKLPSVTEETVELDKL